ncbi:DUF2163 domain-containing protein [Falsiruegeria litorea]|uniref:DUF2163 domain-containing protein n=1 Tax=Falsiruegeria litorea TaxID=1280831 RepID=UPI001BFE91B1|nr:DUF2163 domain-containing protein [Falsiruegeria litorea]MBT8169871.1 DUF2163 domain-containing protein [Falsiruegeria litorea]
MTAYTDTLEIGSTTLCRCFRLTRGNGQVMGFTDHDEDVSFAGVTYRAGAALGASEAASTLGLAPDEMDASGALSHDAITEADLAAGEYDGAKVEVWDVNWANTLARGLLGRYTIGEIERGGLSFRAELRSISASLDRAEGRVHTTLCDARRLGDTKCKLNLSSWQATGTVIKATVTEIVVSGLDGFDNGFFNRGILEWTTGANLGTSGDIRVSVKRGAEVILSLWHQPARAVSVGDTITVTAGCDRTSATCRDRFSNLINFRGFPHMPGDAFLNERGKEGDPDQTGGSRFE